MVTTGGMRGYGEKGGGRTGRYRTMGMRQGKLADTFVLLSTTHTSLTRLCACQDRFSTKLQMCECSRYLCLETCLCPVCSSLSLQQFVLLPLLPHCFCRCLPRRSPLQRSAPVWVSALWLPSPQLCMPRYCGYGFVLGFSTNHKFCTV